MLCGGEDPRVRIGSHSAGVRSLVVVEGTLVVLAGFERQDVLAVAQDDEAGLFAFEKFFDDEASGELCDGSLGFGAITGNDDALSGGEAIGFDHQRIPEGRQCGNRGFRRIGGFERRCGDAVLLEEALGEDLAALQSCCFRRWTDQRAARGPEPVRDTFDEGRLGAHNGQIGSDMFGEGEIVASRRGEAGSQRRGSGVPRAETDAGYFRTAGQTPSQGMLAAAAAYDQDLHFQCLSAGAWPAAGERSKTPRYNDINAEQV